jgi:hypothetical protein
VPSGHPDTFRDRRLDLRRVPGRFALLSQIEIIYPDGMSLLRVLIPSWKFFGEAGQIPRIRYRFGSTWREIGEWVEPQKPVVKRGLGSLFLNAEENLWLAKLGLVDRLTAEAFEFTPPQLSHLQEQISYQLVLNWMRLELREHQPLARGVFQFEIQIEDAVSREVLSRLLSPVHEI